MSSCIYDFFPFALSYSLSLSFFLSLFFLFLSIIRFFIHLLSHICMHCCILHLYFSNLKKKISRNRTEKTDNSATRDSNFLLSNPFVLADCILASFPPSPRVFYNSSILACSLFVKIFAIFCRFSVPYFYPLSAI